MNAPDPLAAELLRRLELHYPPDYTGPVSVTTLRAILGQLALLEKGGPGPVRAAVRSEEPEVITTVYPHRVNAKGNSSILHGVDGHVFWNGDLAEWETPLVERLKPGVDYEMTISLREAKR